MTQRAESWDSSGKVRSRDFHWEAKVGAGARENIPEPSQWECMSADGSACLQMAATGVWGRRQREAGARADWPCRLW